MKINWMVFLGLLLISAGLANSLYGIRQTPSPFDIVEVEQTPGEASSSNPETTNTIEPSEIVNFPGSIQSIKSDKKTDLIIEDTSEVEDLIPQRVVISGIDLDAPVIPTKIKEIEFEGQTYYQWLAPNKPAIGWHDSSAKLGQPGNTVLNGHHNTYGEVFKRLVEVHEGDLIEVYSGNHVFRYRVALSMLVPERFKSLSIRLENARWLLPTDDERLTLITCWPAESNTHRVIIVALPEK